VIFEADAQLVVSPDVLKSDPFKELEKWKFKA
jgi:hypothetical protein